MPRGSAGKRKSAGSSSFTSSSSSSPLSPLPASEDALHSLVDPYPLPLPPVSSSSYNNKRIRAPSPSSSFHFSPSKSLHSPPPHPPPPFSSSSASSPLVSNAELDLHSSPDKTKEEESELCPDVEESELPSSALSSSTLSPFRSPARRLQHSAFMSSSPLRSPSDSPFPSAFRSTPSKRFSPGSGHSALFPLSPLDGPPRHVFSLSPSSPLRSPHSSSIPFRSPPSRSSRSRLGGSLNLSSPSSPSPSRARSLAPTFNMSSLALPPSPLPLHALMITPTNISLGTFPWDGPTPSLPPPSLSPLPLDVHSAVTPKKRKRSSAAVEKKKKNSSGEKAKGSGKKLRASAKEKEKEKRGVAEMTEDSMDSLTVLLPNKKRLTTPTLPELFSPSRGISFPTTSLLSAPEKLLATPSFRHSNLSSTPLTLRLHPTPSSSSSRSSTASSSSTSMRTTSFSIIGATPSPTSSATVRAALLQTTVKVVKQRLTFEGPGKGKEKGEGEKKEPPSSRKQLTTEFIMSDDGLLEQITSYRDTQQRSLFAYRASTAEGALMPARFSPSPLEDAAMSPLRPRSYTFAKRPDLPPLKAETTALSPAVTTEIAPSSPSPPPASCDAATLHVCSHPPMSPTGICESETPDPLLPSSSSSSSALSAAPVPLTPAQLLQAAITAPPNASGVISIDGVPVKAKQCACKKSKCLKLYCECFAHGRVCVDCNCSGCHNTDKEEHQAARQKAIQQTRDRDANAFYRAAPLKAIAKELAVKDGGGMTVNPLVAVKRTGGLTALEAPITVKEEITASAAAASSPPTAVGGATVGDGPSGLMSTPDGESGQSDGEAASGGDGGPGAGQTAAAEAANSRKGCNCKRSQCRKRYCECFQLGIKCTARCKCEQCANGKEHSREEEGGRGMREEKEEGGGKVKGVFVNVAVASHNPSAPLSLDGSSLSSQAEDAGKGSKLTTWRLLPTGTTSAGLVSNAPPIPITPLAPFSLPEPFELFSSMRKPVSAPLLSPSIFHSVEVKIEQGRDG